MHWAVATVTVLLIVGGIAPAMAEAGIDHRMRPAANFAAGQAVEDPRVNALETMSEMSVERVCNTGAGEWCQTSQQTRQTSMGLLPVVLAVAFVASLVSIFARK